MKQKKKRINDFTFIEDLHYCDLDPRAMPDSVDGDY